MLVSNAKLLDTLDTLQRNMCALYSKWGVVQQRQIICAEDTIQCLVLVQRALRIMVQSTIPSVELDVLVMSITCLCLNNHPVQQWPLGWWNTSKVTTALHLCLLWSTIVNYVSGMPLLCMYNTNGRFNITVTLRLLWPIMPPSTRETLALGVDLKEAGVGHSY